MNDTNHVNIDWDNITLDEANSTLKKLAKFVDELELCEEKIKYKDIVVKPYCESTDEDVNMYMTLHMKTIINLKDHWNNGDERRNESYDCMSYIEFDDVDNMLERFARDIPPRYCGRCSGSGGRLKCVMY